jgi:spore photoproduct lyase
MPSVPFIPSRIFVEKAVEDLPLTRRILNKFSRVPREEIPDAQLLKKTADMTWAKKGLVLARMRADPLKEFRAMGRYYSLDLISNCHLECTYCILQSYLENNPVITIFTNVEEILERLADHLAQLPAGSVIGTGKIADSLALDGISEHTKYLVPFFARFNVGAHGHAPLRLELKTKSDQIQNLLGLDHGGRTVVSWSMNPPEIIAREEFKTASFEERLAAALLVSEAGYPVGFHFDPVIAHEGWRENYRRATDRIFESVPPEKIAWMSVGTLRFPARQARIMRKRFPKNASVLEGLISTSRRFLHYSDELREEVQRHLEERILRSLPRERIYRCMDFEPPPRPVMVSQNITKSPIRL